ncbi:hypothetical protein AVEN_234269-1 [Araneus ventricosus]|uniref:Uncharacterized protein n=1 Tax=Araneus ventricosus TaxID=182803 RepID=A0A4Y2A976_ARAVE|nr:hypothetical protein AVEN_234269-1 [Araneus ventricosus]
MHDRPTYSRPLHVFTIAPRIHDRSTPKPVVRQCERTVRSGAVSNRRLNIQWVWIYIVPFGLPGHKTTPAGKGACVCAGNTWGVWFKEERQGVDYWSDW